MNCIYCGKYVEHDYMSMGGEIRKNVLVKQSEKYGKTISAHMGCYLYNIDVRRNNSVKS